jgi:hypothetical protein
MFRSPPAAEVASDVIVTSVPLIPLSHLSLDLCEPPIGWVAYLNNVGIEILTDDVGRASIHRHDARRLLMSTAKPRREKLSCVPRLRRRLLRLIRSFDVGWVVVCRFLRV